MKWIKNDNPPAPCETLSYGELEDYSIYITGDDPEFPEPGAYYRIVFRHSGKAIRPIGGSTGDTEAEQWEIENDDIQLWRFDHEDGEYYSAINKKSCKAFDVFDRSANDIIGVWSYHGGSNQQIKFVETGDGYYNIYDKRNGYTLDVTGSSQNNGARIISYPFHGGANKEVQFIKEN